MLDNVIVVAGGYGTRLKGYKNPLHCKSLIVDENNITLIEHTLRRIQSAKIANRALLVSRGELQEEIEKIARKVGIKYLFIDDSHAKYQGVRSMPITCREELGGKAFFIVCGHAPAEVEHLRKMLFVRKNDTDEVITLYKYRNEEKDKLLKAKMTHTNQIDDIYNADDIECNSFEKEIQFLESPYILHTDIIDLLEKDGCKRWLGSYIRDQIKSGTKVYGIQADFPSEADTPSDLDNVLQELSQNLF